MSGKRDQGAIDLDRDRCSRCGVCRDVCPFGSVLLDPYPVIDDSCRLCGACIKACPEVALILREALPRRGPDEGCGVMVFAERDGDAVRDVAFELLSKGRELADELAEPLVCALPGPVDEGLASSLVMSGADRVLLLDDPCLTNPRVEALTAAMAGLVGEVCPSILLIGATSLGRSLGPRLAVRLRTGLTADCTGLAIGEHEGRRLLLQTRPAFGGNVMATIVCPDSRPQMATVRPRTFPRPLSNPHHEGDIARQVSDLSGLTERIRVLDIVCGVREESIVDADVVVAGGRGLGDRKGLLMLRELADLLGGVVGVSRPLVDEGWTDHAHQVGLSGRTVSPRLYIACGISGAVQHMAGMQTSEVIVAINNDPEAPIFDHTDFGIVGDVNEVIPVLTAQLRRALSQDDVRDVCEHEQE